jgi:hypothetical protein
VLTTDGVDAFVFEHQSLNRPASYNVGLNDLLDVGRGDSAIPDRLGIHHEIRPVLALIQAS